MSVDLSNAKFNDLLQQLAKNYKIIGPVRQKGKGKFSDTDVIGYDELTSLDELVLDEKSYFSPKEHIFPIRETLFFFNDGKLQVPEVDDEKIIMFIRPCDINGIRRLDSIFIDNGEQKDFYYKRLREKVKFFMIECTEGFESCYCVSMDSNQTDDYAVAIRFGADQISAKISDPEFNDVFSAAGVSSDFEPDFITENKVKVNIPNVDSVDQDQIFNHEIWKEYTARCIACGRCNTSCITCSCFSMQDVTYDRAGKQAERRRVWAGCHIDGFSDMAGGHSFRKKNGDRMRFKTMHKINDFKKRFDFHMCVGCGRCDDVCPEYISFSKCINKIDDIVKEISND
ncbi:MAG: anaerobic sulfite reductase subunit AsrA [Lentisphaeria bacterium]|nr:anaerobic sulfite reductase subunit AsrA [Lentisphaeria bacterium]